MEDLTNYELLQQYFGELVQLQVTFRDEPIRGRLTYLGLKWCHVERLSGTKTSVKLSSIVSVDEARPADTNYKKY